MMARLLTMTGRMVARFARCRRAGTATLFALSLPLAIGAVGVAIDYGRATLMRTKMQSVADSAALMSARQMQLATATADRVAAFAKSYVTSQLAGVTPTINVDMDALVVTAKLDTDYKPVVGVSFLANAFHLTASATAKLSNNLPLCMLGLDQKAPATVGLEQNALMTAPGCLVYSNSKSPNGLSVKSSATLKAGFICSAGGKVADSNSNYNPQPATDCPVMPDPLAMRPPPPDGPCNHLAKIVLGGSTTLQPGVYCGGLIISMGADVKMMPGVYIIKDGPFLVNGDATLTGDGVGIYLKGLNSNLKFDEQTTISLTAPKDGPMAGLLIYDDPTGAPALLQPLIAGKYTKLLDSAREHLILSDNARTLIGTIYMPKGRLIIDANKPLADKSAYTVLVVQQLDLYSGPNLILNSDYGASEVPVPPGVGLYGGTVSLTN
jgi:Flp pilus assembly protein TadG